MVYYTSSLTGTMLGGRPQADFACLCVAELVCNLIGCLASRHLPRRTSMILLAFALALAHVLLSFSDRYALRLAVSLVIKGAVSSYVLLCFLHLQESYPTGLRTLGVSAFQCVYWTSASLEPFARDALGVLLPAIYAVTLAISALVVWVFIEETLGRTLLDMLPRRMEDPVPGDAGARCGQGLAEAVHVERF